MKHHMNCRLQSSISIYRTAVLALAFAFCPIRVGIAESIQDKPQTSAQNKSSVDSGVPFRSAITPHAGRQRVLAALTPICGVTANRSLLPSSHLLKTIDSIEQITLMSLGISPALERELRSADNDLPQKLREGYFEVLAAASIIRSQQSWSAPIDPIARLDNAMRSLSEVLSRLPAKASSTKIDEELNRLRDQLDTDSLLVKIVRDIWYKDYDGESDALNADALFEPDGEKSFRLAIIECWRNRTRIQCLRRHVHSLRQSPALQPALIGNLTFQRNACRYLMSEIAAVLKYCDTIDRNFTKYESLGLDGLLPLGERSYYVTLDDVDFNCDGRIDRAEWNHLRTGFAAEFPRVSIEDFRTVLRATEKSIRRASVHGGLAVAAARMEFDARLADRHLGDYGFDIEIWDLNGGNKDGFLSADDFSNQLSPSDEFDRWVNIGASE